jgi:hypothetical protein
MNSSRRLYFYFSDLKLVVVKQPLNAYCCQNVYVKVYYNWPPTASAVCGVVREADVNSGVRAGKTRTGLHRNIEVVNKRLIIKRYWYRNETFMKTKWQYFFISCFPISEKHRFWKVSKRHPLVLMVRATYRWSVEHWWNDAHRGVCEAKVQILFYPSLPNFGKKALPFGRFPGFARLSF